MALPSISTPKVKTVNKDLEAWIRLPALEEGEHYTIEYLHEVLRVNQITYGIDEAQLQKILDEEIYEQDVLVARGIPAVEGQDGFYEYKVNMNLEKKPKILPDGSVDYWSMYSVQSVQKDQVIAIYHPAVKGTDGIGVSGKPIAARVAREQGTLRGTGFGRSEDYLTYFSLMDGKIDIENDKIRIQPIYEVSGDANLTTGSIDFTGDIVIHGSVESGVTIKATGSITIDGNVEACNLEAGKDIVSYTPVANGYELSLSDGSKLTITNGKDGENGQPGLNGETVIPKFKVSSDNYWQVSTDDGKTYEYVLDADGNKVNATGKKGEQGEPGQPGEPGQDASANVSINKDGYIVIGDVVTSLKTDTKVPSIVINEVDGLYVITLDGKEYKMLAEGSAYNGLQSIIYRRLSIQRYPCKG